MDAIIGTNFLPEPLRTTVNGNLSRLGMSAWLRCTAHEYRLAAAGQVRSAVLLQVDALGSCGGCGCSTGEAGSYSAHFDGAALPSDPSHRGPDLRPGCSELATG
jgi:hypothetical protein